jgi:subtilase family serine protease
MWSYNHPYFKRHPAPQPPPEGTWDIPDLCKAYSWPAELMSDAVIGIGELGGGYLMSDIQAFCEKTGIPVPAITDVSVDAGATNSPGMSDADIEVTLDILCAATAFSMATGKPANIVMFWANNDLGGIASATRAATAHGCDVMSWSWGSDESMWGQAAGQDMEQAALEACEAGMIVFAASGDNSSSDGGMTPANVDLPSSAPHVVGVGGTTKTKTLETTWGSRNPDGSGGGCGYSTLFPPQPWQVGAPPAPSGLGRMVPDLACNANPETGYNIIVRGEWMPVGGTSAAAPMMAGLFAAFGTKLDDIHPKLWSPQNRMCFNTNIVGPDGIYSQTSSPGVPTGLGSPIGTELASVFVAKTA